MKEGEGEKEGDEGGHKEEGERGGKGEVKRRKDIK